MKIIKISFLLFYCFLYFGLASAIEISKNSNSRKINLQFIKKIEIAHKLKFKNTLLGGLSGLAIEKDHLYAVSDDRGRFGPVRIYEWLLISDPLGKTWSLSLTDLISLEKAKRIHKKYVDDLEAIVKWKDGFLISSEGDLNSKPRSFPEIFYFDKTKRIPNFVKIPEEFLPRSSGAINKGLSNNMAFEGMTLNNRAELLLMSESGLIQEKEHKEMNSYLLKYHLINEQWKLLSKSRIDFSKYINNDYLYFGATEITFWKENKYFILTRGVRFSLGLEYDCKIWLLDGDGVENGSLTLVADFMEENWKVHNLAQNYEGMAIFRNSEKNYLIVVSDDNFNKNEKTEFLVLKINF